MRRIIAPSQRHRRRLHLSARERVHVSARVRPGVRRVRAQRVREQRPVARGLHPFVRRVHAPSQRRRRQLHGPALERHHVSARVRPGVFRTRTHQRLR